MKYELRHRPVYGTDSNSSYGVATADSVIARSSVLTAPRNYTILNTDAVGARIEIINHSSYVITLLHEGGGAMIGGALSGVGASLLPGRAVLEYHDNGAGIGWRIVDRFDPP